MSWRHPAARPPASAATAASRSSRAPDRVGWRPSADRALLVLNLHHLTRVKPGKKRPRLLEAELGVLGLDEQEELVLAGELEPRRVEHRVIGLRQPIEHEQTDDRGEHRAENRALERRRDERDPRVVRPAA